MPLDCDFAIPFRSQVSPDLDQAAARNVAWLRRLGVLTSDRSVERYTAMRFGEAAARAYPHARGADLDVATDTISWLAMCDDLLGDLARATTAEGAAVYRACLAILAAAEDGNHTGLDSPFVHVFEDLWGRLAVGMSTAWRRRFLQGTRAFVEASWREAMNVRGGTHLTVREYRQLRGQSINTQNFFALTERTGHFEVCPALVDHPTFHEIQNTGKEMVAFINDVFSMEAEEERGDINNLVLVIRHERSCTTQVAVESALGEIRATRDRFMDLQAALPAVYRSLDLGLADRAGADRFVEGIRDVVASTRDWSPHCARYARNAHQP